VEDLIHGVAALPVPSQQTTSWVPPSRGVSVVSTCAVRASPETRDTYRRFRSRRVSSSCTSGATPPSGASGAEPHLAF
jgi:hypothetical protein